MNWNRLYPCLAQGIHLKILETPCAYNLFSDDLYELGGDALDFLSRCDGTRTVKELEPDADFLSYCLEEKVLDLLDRPQRHKITIQENETPSLRYLMVEVTERCNLRCRHCYLGDAGSGDLDWDTAVRVLDDFEDIGGLRLMITGGEPLLYPYFDLLNRHLGDRSYRSVLISNGTLMDDISFKDLNFQEIQFSVDGLQAGHDYLRGKGTFDRAMKAMRSVLGKGLDVSVATVIHSRNLDQLEELGEVLFEMDVASWTLEFPVPSGRLAENRKLMPQPEEALPFWEMEWGWGAHEGAEGYACGAHLAGVDPGGRLVKCGYYRDVNRGDVSSGLRRAWRELPRMTLEGTCAACEFIGECGGGCRFRAQLMAGAGGPDPVMCSRFGRDW